MPVSVSGLTSDFDSQALIDKLVELEKKPLKRLEEEKEISKLKVEVLEMIKNDFKTLRDTTKSLYGVDNVFKKKSAKGVDETSFSVKTLENASLGPLKIEILQIAQPHSVSSDPFLTDTVFPAGSFKVKVGTNIRFVSFDGGTAEDLAFAINKQAGDVVNASAIRDTPDSFIFQLTGLKTGKDNTLSLFEDSGVFSKISLVKPKKNIFFNLSKDDGFREEEWQSYSGNDKKFINLQGNALFQEDLFIVNNKAVELKIDEIKVQPDTVLEITGYNFPLKEDTKLIKEEESNIFTRLFSVKVKDIEISGGLIPVNETESLNQNINIPETESGIGIAYGTGKNRKEKSFFIEKQISSMTTNSFSLSIPVEGVEKIDKIFLFSLSPYRVMAVSDIKIRSTAQSQYDFARTIQNPQDAIFKINDVEIKRPENNNISDVVKGLVFDLKAPTAKPVTFTVDYSMSDIFKQLVQFVSNYNTCMDTLNQISRTTHADKPGDYDKSEQGLFSTDSSFMNIRSKMRTIVLSPYPTSVSNNLAVSAQLGLSTGAWNSAFDDVRSGKLKLDQNKFEEVFRKYPVAVMEFFGSDTDNDKKINEGLAFRMDNFLLDVTRVKSGIIDVKIEKIKEDIRNQNTTISQKEEDVQKYESKLKEQFGNMERKMSTLKAQQKWLDQRLNQKKNED